MANENLPNGAHPAGRVLSMRSYAKGTNAAIYPNDFVKMGADGKVVVATAGSLELFGVAVDYAAATDTSVLILDDPHQLYYIRDDGVGATLAATNVGNNVDFVATAGNSTLLKSLHVVDTSTISGTTSTASLRILGKHPDDTWAKYVRILVSINEHHRGDAVGI